MTMQKKSNSHELIYSNSTYIVYCILIIVWNLHRSDKILLPMHNETKQQAKNDNTGMPRDWPPWKKGLTVMLISVLTFLT